MVIEDILVDCLSGQEEEGQIMTRLERFALWCFTHKKGPREAVTPSDVESFAWGNCIQLERGAAVLALEGLERQGMVIQKTVSTVHTKNKRPFLRYTAFVRTEYGRNLSPTLPSEPWEIFWEEEESC